ncbi:MAG: class I SAM-dependent methyltransferase [Crocinitomicaceae bacterium]|jgi:caffeoyl-CoA O-methyltransferase|nr:class I SAM-dependent methyltransferase [Crocinitomicaceae bacterium]
MEFLPEAIDTYSRNHTSIESELLRELNRETHLKVLSPRMLSGHLQGRFLSMISHMLQPEFILEIGTYTGYSAICLSEGLSQNGKLVTIDNNRELEPILQKYLLKSEKAKQIEVVFGNASEIIPALSSQIDLVFIDADKENYAVYFDLVIDKVRSGGFILADNVLWSGKVVEPVKSNDRSTKALMDFNEKVQCDSRVENMLLPLRDGIMVMRKI